MYSFNVAGMTCGHCAQAITQAIKNVDPDASVEVDVEAGTVSVQSTAPEVRIVGAIQNEGYEAARSQSS